MTAQYSVQIHKYNKDEEACEPDGIVTIASITIAGESALARVLHGYAESIEDELPPRQYESDPPIIVRPEWFEKALTNATKLQEMGDRARHVFQEHSSPNARIAALYILEGDEKKYRTLFDPEPVVVENAAEEVRVF